MLSVCMIVKNESQHLANTLASIARQFDDIVVVDTGSTDGTQEIARRYVGQVHHFEWINDFSAARNYSLSLARHDWVLVVDADEELADIDHAALAALLQANPQGIGQIDQVNHLNENGEISTVTDPATRLFRRSLYHYQGTIHEQVHPRQGKARPLFRAPISVDHVGYQTEVLASKDKLGRNIALLRAALQDSPQDAYLHYQLGKSLYLRQDYAQACESFAQALRQPVDFSLEYSQNLIECHGYALLNSGRYDQAMALLRHEPYCQSVDFAFLKALILMNNGDLQGAVDTFLQCIRMPAGRKEGVNSFKALYNIGVILECSDRADDASTFYQACGEYAPAAAGIRRLQGQA